MISKIDMSIKSNTLRAVVSIILLLTCTFSVFGQNTDQKISVNDPRPLAAAIDELSRRIKTSITFEEAPLEHPADLGRFENIIVAKGGSFDFAYSSNTPPLQVVEQMVEEYSSIYVGQVYKVTEEGGLMHVYPASMKAVSGEIIARTSVLDIKLDIMVKNQTAGQIICGGILPKLSEQIGTDVMCGVIPTNRMSNKQYEEFSIEDQSLRLKLSGLLLDNEGNLTWRIFWSPNSKNYLFNIISY